MQNHFAEGTDLLKRNLPSIVYTETETLYRYSFDSLKISFLPEAVIIPEEPSCIQAVLQLANQFLVPVTVRGVGSTLTGGATPVKGGWVLDLHKLNHITIDPIQRFADVGCGAVTKDIQDAAAAFGLYYPPDPSSYKWCTIGGNIACNAGGLRCVKYGVTRDYVIELRGFMPDGTPVEWAKPVRKFATGYNIRDLWIGSEGTLGVITSATLKLIPKPIHRQTILLGFNSESAALNAILDLLQKPITPSILEFIDTLSVRGAQEAVGHTFFSGQSNICVVLVELDAIDKASITRELELLHSWIKSHTSMVTFSSDEDSAEKLWAVRRKCSGAMFKLGNSKLNEDVVVPLPKMPELVAFAGTLRQQYQIPIAIFGHAGDGNLHVNIMYNCEEANMVKRAETCLNRLMEKVISLNGAISGEHGVGLAKSHFINLQFSEAQTELMRAIKRVFDPNGILNPGKIFEPFSPWTHKREIVQLPWDKK